MSKVTGTVCRICLREGPHCASLKEGRRAKMLALLRGTDEKNGDSGRLPKGLPSTLCADCDRRLPGAAAFVALCRRSERRLQRAQCLNVPFNSSLRKIRDRLPSSIESDEPSSHNDIEVISALAYENPDTASQNPIECDVCGLRTRCKSALIIHFRSHNGERPYKCPHCEVSFAQSGTLSEHIKRKHTDADRITSDCFACEYCGKQFVKKGDMLVHLRVHTKEKPYQCSFCPSRFAQKGTLNQHVMLHTGERPFSCKVCDKKFIAKTSLQRHLMVHSSEKKFNCAVCEKPFKSNAAVKKHVALVHLFEKPDICEKCGVAFSNKSNLKSHMKSVHSESSGHCDVCKKHFSNLNEHIRVHTGETPFSCHLCNKSFALKRSLTAHVNKHENASKFICNVEGCSKTFSMQCVLKFHMLKFHSNHTPHICQYCSKGFYRLSDLSKHIKNTHLIKDKAKF